MRITHAVRSDSFAGVERYIVDVSVELAGRGFEVAVIGGEPGRMRDELPAEVSWSPARTVREASGRLISAGRRDVVHAHMTAAELAAAVSRPWHRAALVTTRHFAGPRGRRFPTKLVGLGIRSAMDAQVSISRFVADAIDEPSIVVPNAVSSACQATLRDRTVLMLQRLEPEKLPHTALHAWAASTLPRQGWTLQIGGRGSQEAALKSLAVALEVDSSVQFLGHVRDTETLLSSASLFLATAGAEPFGLAVVEAMAHGLPVVVADGGAHRETVERVDLLFPPGDWQACAALLDRWGADAEGRRRTGASLRERQRALFAMDRHVDDLVRIYERALDERSSR